MMADSENKWVIKDARGRIYGPFNTAKVLSYIERGVFSGGEMISKYPGCAWQIISKEIAFYDKLLEVLATDGTKPLKIPERNQDEENKEQPNSGGVAVNSHATAARSHNTVTSAPKLEIQMPSQPRPKVIKRGPKPKSTYEKAADTIIELTNVSQLIHKARLKKVKLPLIIIGAVFFAGLIWIFSTPGRAEKIHLLAIRPGQSPISASAAQQLMQSASRAFERDTFDGYLQSQNSLVQVIEGAPKNVGAMALLCLTYHELWPFAHQDSIDINTVNSLSQKALEIDPAGAAGATCRASQLMIAGRFAEAESVVQSAIEAYPTEGVLYQLMSEIMASHTSFEVAIEYAQKTEQLSSGWLKPFVSHAIYLEAREHYGEAEEILRKVLERNPNHAVAKIELGGIQLKYFHDFDKAQDYLQSALSGRQRMTAITEAKGYLSLAKVFIAKDENRRALSAAKKCYSLNSFNSECKEIVIKLGGYETLSSTPKENRDAMNIGDTFAKSGDCFAAQAEYKAAYENDNKNATAAFKAAKCLWKLSYSQEAVDWLNKAIQADASFTEAYTTLADYQAQRFNFDAAFRILHQIQRLKPKDFKVYQGFAQVEYRRKNYQAAIGWGEQALKLYDTDVETQLLMSKCYLEMRNFNEAYRYATRAVELDHNYVDANCLYAKVLASVRGTDAGIHYLMDFANRYSSVLEYRLALAEIYANDERLNEARDAYRAVLTVDAQNKKALLGIGLVYQKQNLADDALQSYLQAAAVDPGDAEPLFRAGILYYLAKKYDFAITQLNRVLQINNLYPEAHYYLGRCQLQLGNIPAALDEAEKERKINPNLADAYLLKAEAYTKAGQFPECAGEYQKAIKLRPESSTIYVRIAQCYRQSGNLDIALSMLKLAAQKESGNAEIYKEQGLIYEAKGDPESAIKAFDKYLILAGPGAPDRAIIEGEMRKMGGSPSN